MEDFVVRKTRDGYYRAWYTKGKETWYHQSLYTALANDPLGPFKSETLVRSENHIRLEKAVIGMDEWYGTAVYRKLPFTGIWHFTNELYGTVRSLIIPPKPKSLWSVSACNPCLFQSSLFFEGRTDQYPVLWRIFQADITGEVDPEPICEGGNPYVTMFGNTVYLYFSKMRPQRGFDTWVMTQPAV